MFKIVFNNGWKDLKRNDNVYLLSVSFWRKGFDLYLFGFGIEIFW